VTPTGPGGHLAIEIENVRFRYREDGPEVLSDVGLTLPAGARLLVTGPSGSGKSTLLRLFNGLVPQFHGGVLSGRVRVAGRDPVAEGPAALSDTVGFVFQNPEAQFVAQRVEDEVAFALENHGVAPQEMRRRLDRVLAGLDLTGLRRRRLSTLSGGERQRVALASALVMEPAVLVLDEPTSQLDPAAAEDLFGLLDRLHDATGVTLVLSEHRLARVAHRVDRVCHLPAAGEPPRVGDPRRVLADTDLAPPVTRLGHRLGWSPVPLTVEEARSSGHPSGTVSPGGRASPVTASGAPGEPLLRVRELSFRYPGTRRDVLRSLSLDLAAGERVALMGPNGSGKSTLLKMLVGLLHPDRGSVVVAGRDARELDLLEITATVGFVPQNPSRLLFQETVAGEVRYTRESHGLPPAAEEEGAPRPLARLGLATDAGRHPFDLSTGERQRAALAAILAAEPRVLLLDEPTRGLDTPRKEALARLLAELAAEGTAVLLATHDVELAAGLAARAVVLEEGLKVADGPVREVLAGTVGERLGLQPQVLRLFGDPRLLTVEDALARFAGEGRA
jgi:energy-coupling factor transporter ATP-binding protein EcfA2